MKLYFASGSCGLAPQIALREAGQTFDMVEVDFKTKQTVEGDYFKVTPKGFVPALQIDGGEVITEGAIVLQWIADAFPEQKLLPSAGTLERYRALAWLNYVATDMHKGFATLFSPFLDDASKTNFAAGNLSTRFEYIDEHLLANEFILGDHFSVIDAYLFNILTWAPRVNVDLSGYAGIQKFMARIAERPTVQAAMKAEGLL